MSTVAKHAFVNIVMLPPPDCVRCEHPTYWKGTPSHFKSENAKCYSGCRELCSACYYHLRNYEPDKMADYPRRYRRCLDLHEEVTFLATQGITSSNKVALMMGMNPSSLERALLRARHMIAREGMKA